MSMEDRTAMMEFAAVGPTSPTSTTTIANYLGELFPTRATAAGDEGGTPQQTPVQCMASTPDDHISGALFLVDPLVPRRRPADFHNHAPETMSEILRPLVAPRRMGVLVENVEMTPADAAAASKQLGLEPIFAAASDTFDLDGLKFSDAVASGRIRLHAPPAADERWRRLHARKGHTDVQQRWLPDSRHFALYYQREGTAKEQLHHIPKNFTAKTVNGDLEPRTRHWLLGSGYLQDLDEDGRWAASAKPHVTPHGAGPDAGYGGIAEVRVGARLLRRVGDRGPWVRATYSTPDKKKLLRRLHYPDLTVLERWRARDDGRYQNPVSMEELRRINADYVRANRPFVWPLVRDTSATH
ncbi:eIF3-S7, partial [Symbiodinium sp. CCMP2456]